MEIITYSLAEAHEAAVDVILEQHRMIDIQTHIDKSEFTLELADESMGDAIMTLRILAPQANPQVSLGSPFGEKFSAAYRKQFLSLTPKRADGNQAVYTYYNRLSDYPLLGEDGWYSRGDGNGLGYDQITATVVKLADDPNSRRGVMVPWFPPLDAESREPPCMDFLQAVIRNNRLNLRTLFRSQDMLLGLPENLVGIAALQQLLVEQINMLRPTAGESTPLRPGIVTLISLIPHIYKQRDSNYLEQMRAEIHRKKQFGLWQPMIIT